MTGKTSVISKPSHSTANVAGLQITIVREDSSVRKFKGNGEESLQDFFEELMKNAHVVVSLLMMKN